MIRDRDRPSPARKSTLPSTIQLRADTYSSRQLICLVGRFTASHAYLIVAAKAHAKRKEERGVRGEGIPLNPSERLSQPIFGSSRISKKQDATQTALRVEETGFLGMLDRHCLLLGRRTQRTGPYLTRSMGRGGDMCRAETVRWPERFMVTSSALN